MFVNRVYTLARVLAMVAAAGFFAGSATVYAGTASSDSVTTEQRSNASAGASNSGRPADLNLADSLEFSTGYTGVFRGSQVAVFSVGYRFHQNYYGIHPELMFGFSRYAFYANVSIVYNIELTPKWRITLSSGPGLYERSRQGQNLGFPIEFLSRFEVSREIYQGQRIGLSLQHISNAHLGNYNPGTELLCLSYEIPAW